ncbi:hypothetical protein EVB91_239 [Rhizobium phage RHph_I1_18]|nr:hypothetical protein EVB91_239 [Rhizobium phage RHph_I1_18]
MATASVVFAKVHGGLPIIESTFVAQEVPSGSASNGCPAAYNYVVVTPLDGNLWVAFSTSGTPNTAETTTRFPLTTGVATSFRVAANTKVGVLDR